ncbi:fimbrial protein [Enterobacter roggenkampii]|uniref:fimbrial protein n=1 Tax=Enterobacter roggenkampii TaxID=1812935 RepID=UPI0013B3D64C|nr:fimbrial protein [Enterobacter roggenkampii]
MQYKHKGSNVMTRTDYRRHLRWIIGRTGATALAISLVISALLHLPSAMSSDNWDLDGLYVSGAVVESPCGLAMESAHQDVLLGDTGTRQLLNPGDEGPPVSFSLHLTDCLSSSVRNRDLRTGNRLWGADQQAVSVSFSATPNVNHPSLVELSGAGGVALKLVDKYGRLVRINEHDTPMLLTSGQNELVYTVTPVRTSAPLTPGAYRATIDFRMYYE